MRSIYPVEMIEAFVKAAATPARPYGVGELNKMAPKVQKYSQPVPPAGGTTDTAAAQKALQPPPVE